MTIEFGDGSEPLSVARGGVKRWLHCQIADVDALPDEQRTELAAWLESRSLTEVSSLLVTRDDAGSYRLHAGGTVLEVELAQLPMWLQHPDPPAESAPKPAAPPRSGRSRAAA